MVKPRILLLDIETIPGKGYVWNLWDDHMPLERLIEPGRIYSIGWKWKGEKTIYYKYAATEKQRKAMLKAAHKVLSEADAVVTYNGVKFDLPRLYAEFVELRLPPLPPLTHIDLYKAIRKMHFMSNKLAYVGPLLKIGKKVKHEGFPLWVRVMKRDPKAEAKMQSYNAQDVRLLDRGYKVLGPYIQEHPFLHGHRGECSHCGSTKLTRASGPRRTRHYLIERLQCQKCGHWQQGARRKIKSPAQE